MQKNRLLFLLLILCIFACEKIEYTVDNPIVGIPTKVLMHRGNGHNKDFLENTLPAAAYGLSLLDGIELDIQISKDGTLWLDHSNQVFNCSEEVVGCFQEMTDDAINAERACDGFIKYHTLESVFKLMSEEYKQSYISLDVKGQY